VHRRPSLARIKLKEIHRFRGVVAAFVQVCHNVFLIQKTTLPRRHDAQFGPTVATRLPILNHFLAFAASVAHPSGI
jgi:hypothetical protein